MTAESFDVQPGTTMVFDVGSPAVLPGPAAILRANARLDTDTDASVGTFTTVTVLGSSGAIIATGVPRVYVVGATILIATGGDAGLWVVTASGPCTPVDPQPLNGSLVVLSAGFIMVGVAGGSPDLTIPATGFTSLTAVDVAYAPGNSGDWDGNPFTVAAAVDRLAAQVAILLTTPVP